MQEQDEEKNTEENLQPVEEKTGTLAPGEHITSEKANNLKVSNEKEKPLSESELGAMPAEIKRDNKPDLVAKRYSLVLTQQLLEYRTDFADAYAVTDKSEKENTNLYCLVFNQEAPIRLHIINILQTISNPHFITPVASEITFISSFNEYRFVVILSKPKGISLADYIENVGHKAEDFIRNVVVAQCAPILEQLDNLNIFHGQINPKNIFIDPHNHYITLGECISSPPGYSQPILYETAQRAVNTPLGKGEGDTSVDYYALGVVALFTQRGHTLEEQYSDDNIIQEKLIKGSFNALLKNSDLSPSLTDLYRGLLNDKTSMRWNGAQLRDWLRGKYFNLVRISPPIEATRSIMFNDVQYFSLESLAYALFKHWKAAKLFLREDKLTKWVEGSVGNPELADKIRYLQKVTTPIRQVGNLFDNDDELVVRTIHVLNPYGPFQYRNISVNLNAFGTLLAYAFSKKQTEMIQMFGMAFSHNLYGYLEFHSEKEDNQLVWHLNNAMEFITKPGMGFGIERCLYELNPHLHCVSPLVTADFPLTVLQLIEILNSKCESRDIYPMDRHIAAFIASKINMRSDIKIKGLARYPKFSANKHIQAAYLLSSAQRESGVKKLPALAQALAKHLATIADMLHGKAHKKDFADNINKIAKEGSIIPLYKAASDQQFILNDLHGFDDAKKKYLSLQLQLSKLKGNNTIANLGYHYGLRLSVVIAYILCGLEFIYFVAR